MSNLAKFLLSVEKLTGQQNYRKWSLEIKSAAELGDAWEAMIGEDTAVSESVVLTKKVILSRPISRRGVQ